jgi:hypothetical protein
MNKYYTPMTDETKKQLLELRSAHTMWYVYTKENLTSILNEAFKLWMKKESQLPLDVEKYDFESILDECGFHYNEELSLLTSAKKAIWEVSFE